MVCEGRILTQQTLIGYLLRTRQCDMVVGTFDVQARKFTPDSLSQGVVASSH